MNTIARKLLRVDMGAGLLAEEALPSRYADLAGRALASAIIAEESRPDHDPLGPEALLVFAPGLLGAEHSPRPRRLAAACQSPRDGGLTHGNTGGPAGDLLASLGIAALIIGGQATDGQWRRLVIGPEGAALLPASGEHSPPVPNPPGAAASIRIGPAGERLLPTACLVLTEAGGQAPRTVCAGGAGAVMGAKGLREISLQPGALGSARPADGPKLFCPPDCPVRCRDGAGASPRGNPATHGIGGAVKRETGLADPERLEAFMALCDTLAVDAFALADALGLALRARGVAPEARPAAFDRLLEDIRDDTPLGRAVASGPEAAAAYFGLPDAARRIAADKTDSLLTAALMDSLGLCRFAAKAALATPETLDRLARVVSAALGRPVDAASLIQLGEATVRREREYSRKP